jgi:hypothetical protein
MRRPSLACRVDLLAKPGRGEDPFHPCLTMEEGYSGT